MSHSTDQLEAAVRTIVERDTSGRVSIEEAERNVLRYRAWLPSQADATLVAAYERVLANVERINRIRRHEASAQGKAFMKKMWADLEAQERAAKELARTLPRP